MLFKFLLCTEKGEFFYLWDIELISLSLSLCETKFVTRTNKFSSASFPNVEHGKFFSFRELLFIIEMYTRRRYCSKNYSEIKFPFALHFVKLDCAKSVVQITLLIADLTIHLCIRHFQLVSFVVHDVYHVYKNSVSQYTHTEKGIPAKFVRRGGYKMFIPL